MTTKPPETDSRSDESDKPKKPRKMISLQRKLEILHMIDEGAGCRFIGKALGLAPSTVRTIRGNASKIRKTAGCVALGDAPHVFTHRRRSQTMEKMEKLLLHWFHDLRQQGSPVTLVMVQNKALSLFKGLKQQHGEGTEEETFTASRGWFERFRKRWLSDNVRVEGKMIIVDEKAAEKLNTTFKQTTEEKNDMSEDVVIVKEIGNFQKHMPKRTYLTREENFAPSLNTAEDRLTHLQGSADLNCFL